MTTTGEKTRFRVALAASAAILAAFGLPMALGQVYAANDLGIFHLPLRHFYARCLAAGDDFAWFPGIYCGFNLHGEGQVGMYHPLHLLLYSAFPFGVAFNLEILSSYVALLAGMALFLRRWDLPRDAALFGGIVFAFGGYNFGHYFHLNSVAIIAHLPWLLWAIDVVLRGEDRRRAAWGRPAVALLTGSQLLLGHPQSVWFSVLVESLYALFLVVAFHAPLRRLAGLAWAKGLGVLAGAVQLLPTFEAVAGSQREILTRALKAAGSLPPANLIQALAPYLYVSRVVAPPTMFGETPFGPATSIYDWRVYEFGLYNGAMVPALLAWLILRRRQIADRRLARGAALLAAMALVLAFGEYTPLFKVTSELPVLGMFRVPARYLVLFHLATAILAAIAFADLARQSGAGRLPWRSLRPLLILPALGLAIGLGAKALARPYPKFMLRPYFAPNREIFAGVALAGVATLLVLLAARGRRFALIGIVLFAAADEGVYGLTFARSAPPRPLPELVTDRAFPPAPRTDCIRSFDNMLTLSGIRIVDGYVALTPKRELDYSKPACLQVAGASWHIDQPDRDDWKPVAGPLPRARLVSKAIEWPTPNTLIDQVDVRTTALVSGPLRLRDGPAGAATIRADRPGKIRLLAAAPTRQLLVLNERFEKGWQVRVDGRDRRPVKVNGDFLGCPVDPGDHRITFRYRPWSLRLGGRLSLLGLALMAATFWLAPGVRRRGTAQG